jgi:hypothetical protein
VSTIKPLKLKCGKEIKEMENFEERTRRRLEDAPITHAAKSSYEHPKGLMEGLEDLV